MTLQQLRYVTAVAETGTISGAAKALFISQPSLTPYRSWKRKWASPSFCAPTGAWC